MSQGVFNCLGLTYNDGLQAEAQEMDGRNALGVKEGPRHAEERSGKRRRGGRTRGKK